MVQAQARAMPDRVPFVEWTGELLGVARLRYGSTGAVGKPSLNGAISNIK